MTRKARLITDKDKTISVIDDRLYGSFIEHLGRAVYDGIYEPGHPCADEDGFRTDVIGLVKDLNVPVVRYPGGNFVSNYFWEDGVGPKENRKKRLDLAWRTTEPNEVGISEFVKWAKKADTSVMMAVNLGTRGTSDALNLLEYCNLDTDSYYANLRREHGDEKPFCFKLWCMGNEMDGHWQVGHKTAYEYGRLAAETAKAMKMMDDSIECVACGSANIDQPTFATWEKEVLEQAYEYVDYISLHQYFDKKDGTTEDFFASIDNLDEFINTIASICDDVKKAKNSDKTVYLSFDEWNCWYHTVAQDDERMKNDPWGLAPHLLEDDYTFEDAVVNGLALIKFINHSDRVKIACLAQLVNVIAPIRTEKEGPAWKQTIYYPYEHASKYGRGTALRAQIITDTHSTVKHGEVTDVEAAVVLSKDEDLLTVFAVNRNVNEDIELEVELNGFEGFTAASWQALESDDMLLTNDAGNERVKPVDKTEIVFGNGVLKATLKSSSWNVIVLRKEA